MRVSRHRLQRYLSDAPHPGAAGCHSRSEFYREEFLKCQRCLEAQREFYSERAISDVQRALTRVMSQLDRLCTKGDADRVVSQLLRQFDVIARLAVWTDPKQVH